MTNNKEFLDYEKEKQYQTLLMWAKAYYDEDKPMVTDDYYDSCVKSYEELYGERFEYMGAAANAFSKFNHPYPVLSLDKITSETTLTEKLKNEFDDNYVIQPKIDGLTVVYYPDGSMVSRGDGKVGEVLPFAHTIKDLPKPLDKPVRMEIYLPKSVFREKYSEAAKNPRNAAAGIIRRKEYTEEIKDLKYFAYNILGDNSLTESRQLEILEEHGFTTISTFDKKYSTEMIKLMLNGLDFPTDGLVYKYDGENEDLKINTAHHPKNMVAFKYQSEIAKSVLRKIEWSIGRDKYTPVAVFEPVILGGNQISRASVHNLNIINSLKLKIDGDILVTLKNEIIPQIIWCNGEGKDIPVPNYCALCGTKLNRSNSGILTCPNNSCKGKIVSDIKKLVSREGLDIQGISDKIIEKINCKSVKEFLEMKEDDFKSRGVGEKTSKKITENIEKALKNTSPARFLTAMNIPLIGKSQSEAIMNYFDNNIDKFFKDFSESVSFIPGFGNASYLSIFHRIEYLKEIAGKFIFKSEEREAKKNKYRITITGTLSKSRNEIILEVESAGHSFSNSVTASTDYLVASKDSMNSSKYKKAEKLGIRIISEEEMRELL